MRTWFPLPIGVGVEFAVLLDCLSVPNKENHIALHIYCLKGTYWSKLLQGGYGGDKPGFQVASSPPFYCGSPPCRVSNPVIQDARFGNEKITPLSPAPPSPPPSSSSARKGGGCVRMKFGHTPAAVRIEGFDCLRRDGRNCSISAVAWTLNWWNLQCSKFLII